MGLLLYKGLRVGPSASARCEMACHPRYGQSERMSVDNRFDVFLSYNSQDHVPVEVVARWLRDQGLKVFQALGTCRAAAAVFVGSREMGDSRRARETRSSPANYDSDPLEMRKLG